MQETGVSSGKLWLAKSHQHRQTHMQAVKLTSPCFQVLKFAQDLALDELTVQSCGCLGGCLACGENWVATCVSLIDCMYQCSGHGGQFAPDRHMLLRCAMISSLVAPLMDLTALLVHAAITNDMLPVLVWFSSLLFPLHAGAIHCIQPSASSV